MSTLKIYTPIFHIFYRTIIIRIQYINKCITHVNHICDTIFERSFITFFRFSSISANRSSFYYINENGETKLEDLTKEPQHLTVSPGDVKIHYYCNKCSSSGYILPCNDASNIKNTPFDSDKPTLFVIHGWKNQFNSDICIKIKEALLPKFDVNLFVVDWSSIAQEDYSTAVEALIPVAKYIAEFVKLLKDNFGLKLSNLKIVGHSLGGHLAGVVGKQFGGEVSEITGLDPAGPNFKISDKSNRLDSSDAKYVEVSLK